MRSIRAKTTLLTVCAIIISMTIATVLGVIAIRDLGSQSAEEQLRLLCQTGEKNLDAYFKSVEQSVEMVSSYVEADLDGLDDEHFAAHMARAQVIFDRAAYQTSGVLTYYYRIDPAVSDTVKGFWYTDLDGTGFTAHQVTDISRYDTEDTSKLVWFTVPKHTGRSVWLPPYVTDNLDVRVLSYNEPIYYEGQFVGVVGIEIDYSTMAEQVDNIKLYDNGYAFINDEDGKLIYHPLMDVASMAEEDVPTAPEGLLADDNHVYYTYGGVEKEAVWLPLDNGMVLNVTVPLSEINSQWLNLIYKVLAASVLVLVVFVLLSTQFTNHITKPLRQLTRIAHEVNKGNYDVHMAYDDSDDEVGLLSRTFNQLIRHLRVYINDLTNLAYADALTSVHNKGAYDIYMQNLQTKLNDAEGKLDFAVSVFDCDDLKSINDQFGHDKGDVYLKNASALICSVFQHSPVFRTGGDEFAVILLGDDYKKRDELNRLFHETSDEICSFTHNLWEQVRVSMGMAVYDGQSDKSAEDVARRADQLMYENKHQRKAARA